MQHGLKGVLKSFDIQVLRYKRGMIAHRGDSQCTAISTDYGGTVHPIIHP